MITTGAIAELRVACDAARRRGDTVGLVPTMGFFHAGHRSLMRTARAETAFVVVSSFVNPTQFGPGEDLAAYPRDWEADERTCREEMVDVLFAPPVEEMYPEPIRTTVHVDGLTAGLCGRSRPTHFDGVTTVVTKLFDIVGPCRAYFGRKDAQQLAVVARMVRDLDQPVDVVGCPLVREPDGVAMSSRNAYLSDGERVAARVLFQSLREAADLVAAGERDAAVVQRVLRARIEREPGVRLDYAEVVDGDELQPVARMEGRVVLAVAASVGPARLIDNVQVAVDGTKVAIDMGVTAETV